jgi:hypothetical protein
VAEVDGDTIQGSYPFAANRALPWHDKVRQQLIGHGMQDRADPFHADRLRRDVVRGLYHQACRRAQAILTVIHSSLSRHLLEIEDDAIPSVDEIRDMTGSQ